MPDEIVHLETETAAVEAQAAEALASVAETAIEETAARVAELSQARAELERAHSELATLRAEFLAHVESNVNEFGILRAEHAAFAERINTLELALAAAEAELAELDEEIVTEEISEAADVAAAEAEEIPIIQHEEKHERETEQPRSRKRHFIKL